jgi:hypothetical protein
MEKRLQRNASGANSSLRYLAAGLLASAALFGAGAASATTTVMDNYYGGTNTYTGQDVIGDSLFDIVSASFSRIGVGGNTLQVTINTNYAGAPGTGPADGTGYGSLFLTPGANAWQPTGTAPYSTDVYQDGDWQYAFAVPMFGAGGSAGLYAIGATTGHTYGSDGTTVATAVTDGGSVVMSNVGGDPITYPGAGNPGYYFRQGQAVQFTPGNGVLPVGLGSWAVGANSLTFDIVDNGLLGNNFAFSWAMTCGNDVIQGQVSLTPEPGTWAMMMLGIGLLGGAMRTRRLRAATA